MKKGLRKQLILSAMEVENDGRIGLSDIISGDEYPEQIIIKVENYLDTNCSNGHFSRWTAFGQNLYLDAIMLVSRLEERYKNFLA